MSDTTRTRIIQKAHDLFYGRGFHAVGVDTILAEVGVTKTTFYNHFESKDSLVVEVLAWHDRWWRDTFRELLRKHGGDTARGQLLAIFDALREVLEQPDYNGCFFINVAVQFPQAHDPAHQAAVQHKRAMEEIIRELAGFAGASDPPSLAQELALLMEGTYVTQQITRNPQTASIASRIAELIVSRHLAERSPKTAVHPG